MGAMFGAVRDVLSNPNALKSAGISWPGQPQAAPAQPTAPVQASAPLGGGMLGGVVSSALEGAKARGIFPAAPPAAAPGSSAQGPSSPGVLGTARSAALAAAQNPGLLNETDPEQQRLRQMGTAAGNYASSLLG